MMFPTVNAIIECDFQKATPGQTWKDTKTYLYMELLCYSFENNLYQSIIHIQQTIQTL